MTPSEQTRAFCNDLDKLIARYASEFDLTYATLIGCLTLKTKMLCDEAAEEPPEPQ